VPQPAQREPHRHYQFIGRASAKKIAIAPRVATRCCRVRRSRGPVISGYPIPNRRPAVGGTHAGAATSCCECQNRWRSRTGLHNSFATGRWCGPGQP
jgi:hypothetical protein